MSFRKRNVGVSREAGSESNASHVDASTHQQGAGPGMRPSPVDGRATTSTGAASLDALLAGHSGLALGSSLLIEESGTTDYAGSLLRYYAAEGLVQGQHLHLVGLGDRWIHELPGMIGPADAQKAPETMNSSAGNEQKMKIAWRYEHLGRVDDELVSRRSNAPSRASPAAASRAAAASSIQKGSQEAQTFCHAFDLAKRLDVPTSAQITHYSIDSSPGSPALRKLLTQISASIRSAASGAVHRLIVPSLLSPALYPNSCAESQHLLPFLHSLRSLLRQYSDSVTAVVTLPLSLYPRHLALTRWMEHLSDGVMELTPFPHRLDDYSSLAGPSNSNPNTGKDEQPQGLVKFHKLPVFHERGGGGGGTVDLGSNLAFTISRRHFKIKPYSLPPAEGDSEAQQEGGSLTKDQIDF